MRSLIVTRPHKKEHNTIITITITITNNLFRHNGSIKKFSIIHSWIITFIVMEITLGHTYRWHATTESLRSLMVTRPHKKGPKTMRSLMVTKPNKKGPETMRSLMVTRSYKKGPKTMRSLIVTRLHKKGPKPMRSLNVTRPHKKGPLSL